MTSIKRYKFSYQTIVTYQSMVAAYHFMLRCTPCDLPMQRLKECQLHLLSPAVISRSEDAFGNVIHYGYLNEAHDIFVVASNGVVERGDYRIEDAKPQGFYRAQSHLTHLDSALSQFNRSLEAEGDHFEVAVALSQAVHRRMVYCAGVTSFDTTAAEALSYGEGVCQDFSHILLALCRERAIFARYVVGFVVGTGATHAWVEVWCDGVWRGVDPTHNQVAGDGYIKLSHGRDAADCSVIRGTKKGLAPHATQIRVVVEEI
ncbi:MAG: transglutaminase domain-containing protein [Rikenellaceae bacterium]